jgi:DNA-binding NtrC family response regulator
MGGFSMKRKKILIVDDYPATLELMKEILDYEGYQTVTARCGEEALQLNHGDFDLLLTDIVMPTMGGLELIRVFRELSPNTVPMLVTGFPSIETAVAAAEQGIYDYIVKPFDRHRLCTAVSGALKRKCN